MSLCERRFTAFSFLSGGGRRSSSRKTPSTPPSSASAYADFEYTLRHRLRSLLPPPPGPHNGAVPLPYLSLAVDVLASTHADAARLLRDHPSVSSGVGDPGAPLSAYLNTTAGVLELSNAASAVADGLLRRRLLLVHALHLLTAGGAGTETGAAWRFEKARRAVVDWEEAEAEEGGRDRGVGLGNGMDRSPVILAVNNSPSKRGISKYSVGAGRHVSAFERAVVAVEAVFALVRSILLAFLPPAGIGSSGGVVPEVPVVSDAFAWSGAYKELQDAISAWLERGRPSLLELDAVRSSTKELIGSVSNVVDESSSSAAAAAAARELESAVDNLTRGLEGLAEAVTGLFRSALRGRDAAMGSLRAADRSKCRPQY